MTAGTAAVGAVAALPSPEPAPGHPAGFTVTSLIDNAAMSGGRTERIPYQQATRRLLRQSVFDAVHDLQTDKNWSAITMSQIARAAGMSRQTLYNEFGSRRSVAQEYILSLVGGYLDQVETDIAEHAGDADLALEVAFRTFLTAAAADPMVRSAIDGTAPDEVLRLLTSEAGPLLSSASERLADIFGESWGGLPRDEAKRLGRHLVRHALSYVTIAPGTEEDPAADMSRLLAPAVERIIGDAPHPR